MRREIGLIVAILVMQLTGCKQTKPAERDLLNADARMPSDLPLAALNWRTITSGVDRQHGTMTILTGNDEAVKFVGSGIYPAGAKLALTTWLERDDPHWFGARIPGTFVSLETVDVTNGSDGKPVAEYHRYIGSPAHEVMGAADAEKRKVYVLGMTASVMP